MLGAIAGDVIGSVHEWTATRTTDFELFAPDATYTDDTVMTVAVANALMDGDDYAAVFRRLGRLHRGRGYGAHFFRWLHDETMGPYGSWGNGSAMRVSPVGWAFDRAEDVVREARRTAEPTHDHPEGIRGAEAAALAVFLARHGADTSEIRARVVAHSGYDLGRTVDEIRPDYTFNESCQRTVPEALTCFLEARDFEHAVRLAISLGGDADTLACITGAVAEAHWGGVPEAIRSEVLARLAPDLRAEVERFEAWRA